MLSAFIALGRDLKLVAFWVENAAFIFAVTIHSETVDNLITVICKLVGDGLDFLFAVDCDCKAIETLENFFRAINHIRTTHERETRAFIKFEVQ